MAVVVSDTTPVHYLILVGQEPILEAEMLSPMIRTFFGFDYGAQFV
jgi:hypothetical protein